MFDRVFLADAIKRARRSGLWYRALSRDDRVFMELLIRCVDRVRSAKMCVEVVKILSRLKKAAKSLFVLSMETFGVEAARKRSQQAVQLGYAAARGWASDFSFIRYLTAIHVNNPVGF